MILGALLLASRPGWPWRLSAALLTVALAGPACRRVLALRGPRAVRRCRRDEDGSWWIRDGRGEVQAELLPSAAAFGPWILLAWRVVRPGWPDVRHLVIDAACTDARTFRALKGRLRIEAARRPRRACW